MAQKFRLRHGKNILPGYPLSLRITMVYVSVLIVVPVGLLLLKAAGTSLKDMQAALTSPRVLAALELSVSASVIAGLVNVCLGLLLAWVLVRYNFAGRKIANGLVDLPFALPTAVAGISLTTLYGPEGWLGKPLSALGIQVAYSRAGVVLALVFVGLPFVVRTVQPVLADLQPELEEAAAVMGAGPLRIFFSILMPPLLPAMLAGFSLAVARALGEYGSIVFISGNLPNRTEIVPLLIMTRLEEFDTTGAVVLATMMLAVAIILLVTTQRLQHGIARSREGRRA